MDDQTLTTAQELVDEVTRWIASDSDFLSGVSNPDGLSYEFDGGAIPFAVTNAREWHAALNREDDDPDSVYTELHDAYSNVQEAAFTLHQFGCEALKTLIAENSSDVKKAVFSRAATKKLAAALEAQRPEAAEDPEYNPLDDLAGKIMEDFGIIVDARVASLSRRYALTEAVFAAYRYGLVPFGWDWETLWCINPADLDSPGPIPVHDE